MEIILPPFFKPCKLFLEHGRLLPKRFKRLVNSSSKPSSLFMTQTIFRICRIRTIYELDGRVSSMERRVDLIESNNAEFEKTINFVSNKGEEFDKTANMPQSR